MGPRQLVAGLLGLALGKRGLALSREIARHIGLGLLSMGMSADFEKAIRFGATYVRVSTAVLGARGGSL